MEKLSYQWCRDAQEQCKQLIAKGDTSETLKKLYTLLYAFRESQTALFMAMSWWQHLGLSDHPTKQDYYESQNFCTCANKKYNELLQETEWERCLEILVDFEASKLAVTKPKEEI